ncbi:TRAP transporter small permease [Martelella radicis]|uniref:TRAP transporter small permease protein n=1 Tax=Martelella radicis TaxID=1397476 RepID=A0A7W6KIX2_9HYPH|nr:TRAP transporter small permease subunit [Martelella radicis]MBB4121967.1 TRAP-type C4-dicarboxylate transport system permease small subunit [Martelella radicis]
MFLLLAAASVFSRINGPVLALGRWTGALLMGLMVVVILVQVFFRYVLNDALAWTEELARFLMLWMVSLMAPTAFRHGGFISIDTIKRFLPERPAAILNLVLLLVSAIVLWWAIDIGWNEVTGIGGRFTMPSLMLPTALDFSAWMKVPRAWMMASLATGVTMMFSVNIELIVRLLADLFGAGDRLKSLESGVALEAE